jgi:hypothetical protein
VYFDTKPCRVCGADVRLREHRRATSEPDPDGTVDDRVCTDPRCATNRTDDDAPRA